MEYIIILAVLILILIVGYFIFSIQMKEMIGFRNIAIHDYKELDNSILKDVIENHLAELLEFARIVLNLE